MDVTFVTSDAFYVSNIKNIELSAKLKRIPLDIPPICNLQPTEVDILYLPSSINWITMKSFGVLFLRSRAVSRRWVGLIREIRYSTIWQQSHYRICTASRAHYKLNFCRNSNWAILVTIWGRHLPKMKEELLLSPQNRRWPRQEWGSSLDSAVLVLAGGGAKLCKTWPQPCQILAARAGRWR